MSFPATCLLPKLATSMAGVMHLVTDDELQVLAAYLSSLAKCP